MARTALAPIRVTTDGIDPAAVDTAANLADGNSFTWAKGRLLWVANGDDTPLTVTVVTPVTVGRAALAVADATVTVPAGGQRLCGPFGPEFRRADGSVHVDYTGADASVTVAVLDAGPAE